MSTERDPLDELPTDERKRFLAAAEALNVFLPHLKLYDWSRTVIKCGAVYALSIDEYINELDRRKNIQRVLDSLPAHALPNVERILDDLDEQFRRVTVAIERPVYHAGLVLTDPEKYFFYLRLPQSPGEELQRDLISWGHSEELDMILRQGKGAP